MKIGMLVNSQYVAGESMPVKIQESVEQVRAARDAGFDIICAPQHYLTAPYQMSATMPLLARLAGEAGEMEIATAIVLLPLHNPVEMAESVATMDAICGGRFIFGIGLGYRDEEYTAFGMDRSQRVGRAREALEVMKLLWSEGEVEFHGKYYNVPKVQTATRPVQQPHPPIWVAANADAAIRRAARWGYPWLINPHVTVATVAEQLSAYRRLAAEAGHADVQSFPMMRELYVAQDRETAFLESRPYLESKYAAYAARTIAKSGCMSEETCDSLFRAEGTGLGSQRHGHSGRKPSFQTQGVQTDIHQSGKDLTQPRTAQRVPVFIPTAVFHVMQVVLNAPMAAEQPEHLTGAAPVGRQAGQQIPTLFGCFTSGYCHSHLFHHCRLLRPGKPQFLPDIASYFGVGPEPPYLDAVRFFSMVSACGSPSSSSGNPSDMAASKVDRFPLTRTR